MTYYSGHYGSWLATMNHLKSTYSRKKIFQEAHEIANSTGETVTVIAQQGTRLEVYKVMPNQ